MEGVGREESEVGGSFEDEIEYLGSYEERPKSSQEGAGKFFGELGQVKKRETKEEAGRGSIRI